MNFFFLPLPFFEDWQIWVVTNCWRLTLAVSNFWKNFSERIVRKALMDDCFSRCWQQRSAILKQEFSFVEKKIAKEYTRVNIRRKICLTCIVHYFLNCIYQILKKRIDKSSSKKISIINSSLIFRKKTSLVDYRPNFEKKKKTVQSLARRDSLFSLISRCSLTGVRRACRSEQARKDMHERELIKPDLRLWFGHDSTTEAKIPLFFSTIFQILTEWIEYSQNANFLCLRHVQSSSIGLINNSLRIRIFR